MKTRTNTFKLPGKLTTTFMLMLFGLSFTFAQTIPVNCAGGPSSSAYSHIQFVTLEGESGTEIDYTWNYPGPLPTGTENQKAQVVTLKMGQQYEVAFNLWSDGIFQWTSNGAIWIDFNGDGTLSPDERVHWTPPGNTNFLSEGGPEGYLPTGGVWSSRTFTVPLDANPTNDILYVTMRAMQVETPLEQTNPCATYAWGAMIDFTVAVLPADITQLVGESAPFVFNTQEAQAVPLGPLAVVITVLLGASFMLYRYWKLKKGATT